MRCGSENRLRTALDSRVRIVRAGLGEGGQPGPRRAADKDRTDAGEDLAPYQRWHADLRHRKHDLIASKCRRDSKQGGNDGTDDHGACHCEGCLTDHESHPAGGNADKRRSEDAGTAVQLHHEDVEPDKKWQGVYRERENQPAEHAKAGKVQEKSEGEHGGGSICKGDIVAPSTTTTAQSWICNRNEAELRRCNSTSLVWKMAGRRSRSAEFPNGDAEAFRLVGEVVLDSRAREMHDADRQQFEHGVVAPEGCCLGMLGPVRLERDLRHLPGGRPFGSDQLRTFWRAAMDQDHV